jgi:hypothetical protein
MASSRADRSEEERKSLLRLAQTWSVMLFSKAIIPAEWEANAPLREAMAIKREPGAPKERLC